MNTSLKPLINTTFFFFFYLGAAGDSFAYHRGAPFSTKDQDNDVVTHHCVVTFIGGWRYTRCRDANLNGVYHNGSHESRADCINWYHWKGDFYSAMRSEMKTRPAELLEISDLYPVS